MALGKERMVKLTVVWFWYLEMCLQRPRRPVWVIQRAGGEQEAEQLVVVLESSCTIDLQESLNVCMQEGEARPHKNSP